MENFNSKFNIGDVVAYEDTYLEIGGVGVVKEVTFFIDTDNKMNVRYLVDNNGRKPITCWDNLERQEELAAKERCGFGGNVIYKKIGTL